MDKENNYKNKKSEILDDESLSKVMGGFENGTLQAQKAKGYYPSINPSYDSKETKENISKTKKSK